MEDRLKEVYGEPAEDETASFHVLRLAALDAESAREFVKTDESFARVSTLILANKLQSIAGYPAVLDRLVRYEPGASVSAVRVWKDVLIDLLSDKNAERAPFAERSSIDEQFRAAGRIAAILTFGDCEGVDDGYRLSAQPTIDALIPPDHAEARALNVAGRDTLRSTVFRRSLGSLRFAQHHVQQWLAAFGVDDLSLVRLRPLVTDGSGAVLPHHRGVLGLLLKTTRHADVRDWIVQKYGGVPPPGPTPPHGTCARPLRHWTACRRLAGRRLGVFHCGMIEGSRNSPLPD